MEGDVDAEIAAFIQAHPQIKVLFKQGEKGSSIHYLQDGKVEKVHHEAFDFADYPQHQLIDTTGAGDCFTGAFAVKTLEGAPYIDALSFANKVGFLCITKFGAAPSSPSLNDVNATFD